MADSVHGQNFLGSLGSVHTSFYDVKCAAGFRCVSKVGIFGLGHDGPYKKPPVQDLQSRFLQTYEWGCPARGAVSDAGECRDEGKGTTSMCYSAVRYEAGPQTPCGTGDNCFCMKANSSSGTGGERHKHAESIDGDEVATGKYPVLSPAKCEECAQHDCDQRQCDQCQGCEHATKTIAGRKTTGCFATDGGKEEKARKESRDGRKYLPFAEASEQDIAVIPHYDLWNPGDNERVQGTPGEKFREPMPYQSHKEPLSRKAWREEYKQAAPRVQRLLDQLVKKTKGSWARLNEATGTPSSQHLDCFDFGTSGGGDVTGKMERVQAVQRACQHMQDVARSIAKGAQFAAKTDDDVPVNCVQSNAGGGDCGMLNCYSADQGLKHAMRALQARNKQCRLAREYLEKEEAKNGPAPAGARERVTAGRVDVLLGGAPLTSSSVTSVQPQQMSGPQTAQVGTLAALAVVLCQRASSAGNRGQKAQLCRRHLASLDFLYTCN